MFELPVNIVQYSMIILPVKMENWKLYVLLILATTASRSFTLSVKGGYHPPPSENFVSFPAEESGTCYKRVQYTQALADSISNGYVQTVPGTRTTQQGVKSAGPSMITIIDCCDGFVRNKDTGECETHCDEGCFGGVCTGPNICTCDTGFTAIEGICKPVCTRPCPLNSVCHLPNECKCNEGYEKENGECKPVCPGGCRNGDCVAPRLCRCKPGFVLNEAYKECVPICEGGCPNGECAGPGICRCYPGYENPPGDLESCQPICPHGCYGGECLAPNLCKCKPGFILNSSSTCTPTCVNGCENGKCVSPNECSCNPGFELDSNTQRCVSIYDRKHFGQINTPLQQTENFGQVSGTYRKPGIYSQHSGSYGKQSGSHGQHSETYGQQSETYGQQSGTYGQQSEPYGQQSEPYGQQSVSYNQQTRPYSQLSGSYDQHVDAGQQTILEADNLKSYVCNKQCLNGECSRNECICYRGYMLDQTDLSGTRCLPVCQGGCTNGVCTAPNTCLCNNGFEKDRSVKGRQICIPI